MTTWNHRGTLLCESCGKWLDESDHDPANTSGLRRVCRPCNRMLWALVPQPTWTETARAMQHAPTTAWGGRP